MLTTLQFILLHYILQLFLKHHLHCMTFTCHKGLMNIKLAQNKFFLKTYQIIDSLNFESSIYVCLIIPYYYKRKFNIKEFVYYENQWNQ
jgi:hypothetical protein